ARRAGGGEPWALSHRSRTHRVDSRHQEPRRSRHRLRDWNRHEPVPFGCTSHLVGLHMSTQRRECRQASIQSRAQGRYLAQNHAGAVRLDGGKKERQLSAGPIYRIKARRGPKKAIMAVVASILTAIYHMLKDGTMYKDLGRNHFERRSSDQQKNRLVKRLVDLGYAVEIKPLAATA